MDFDKKLETMLEFKINPPILTPWLTPEERERNIILFDLQIDQEEIQRLRFDIDIAFDPIPIRTGVLGRRDYYVGCTGAEISLKVDDGEVIDYTQGSTLNVQYSNKKDYVRNTSLLLKPEIEVKKGDVVSSSKLGEIRYEREKNISFSANFQSGERTLETTHLIDTIKWQISLPRGLKVVRDYLLGNLYLQAVCIIKNREFGGKIKIKPSDVIFFGPDKSPLSKRKSIYMMYVLYRDGIDIANIDGIETNFNQNNYEN